MPSLEIRLVGAYGICFIDSSAANWPIEVNAAYTSRLSYAGLLRTKPVI